MKVNRNLSRYLIGALLTLFSNLDHKDENNSNPLQKMANNSWCAYKFAYINYNEIPHRSTSLNSSPNLKDTFLIVSNHRQERGAPIRCSAFGDNIEISYTASFNPWQKTHILDVR